MLLWVCDKCSKIMKVTYEDLKRDIIVCPSCSMEFNVNEAVDNEKCEYSSKIHNLIETFKEII